jgi:hypothetical protein
MKLPEIDDYLQSFITRYPQFKEPEVDHYLDLQSFIIRYPQFKETQMRWFVVKKDENGLAPAIKRLGRRLYFHVPTFLAWIEKQGA